MRGMVRSPERPPFLRAPAAGRQADRSGLARREMHCSPSSRSRQKESRMQRFARVLLPTLLLASAPALADNKAKPFTPPPPKKEGPPKPGPEIETINWFLGTWDCKGSMTTEEKGTMTASGTYTLKDKNINGFSIAAASRPLRARRTPSRASPRNSGPTASPSGASCASRWTTPARDRSHQRARLRQGQAGVDRHHHLRLPRGPLQRDPHQDERARDEARRERSGPQRQAHADPRLYLHQEVTSRLSPSRSCAGPPAGRTRCRTRWAGCSPVKARSRR